MNNLKRIAEIIEAIEIRAQCSAVILNTRMVMTDEELSEIYRLAKQHEKTPEECPHAETVTNFDHMKCVHCGSVKTDSFWTIAKDKWFKSIEHARFFETHGRLPEEPPCPKHTTGGGPCYCQGVYPKGA